MTGTKRSGTSMWMQILQAGGVELIGEEFPLDWGDRLRDLNPQGFWESRLRSGVNFTSNPDPATGQYVAPHDSKKHGIKIFIPGLVATDFAYLDRVIGTMREWRDYSASRHRLETTDMKESVPEDVRFASRYNMPAHLEWWLENYAMLRDAMLRRYPYTCFSYASITGPEGPDLVRQTFEWLGCGDGEAAADAVIRRELEVPEVSVELAPDVIATFDEFYQRVHEGAAIDDPFLEQLDRTHEQLMPEISKHVHDSHEAMLRLREAHSGAT